MVVKNDFNGWLTTREVAIKLKVSPSTIRRFYSINKHLFEGLVVRSLRERTLGSGGLLLWSPESQRILALGIKNEPVKDWKEKIIKEVLEKGSVTTSGAKENELMKIVSQQALTIQNLERRVEQLERNQLENKSTPRTDGLSKIITEKIGASYIGLTAKELFLELTEEKNISSKTVYNYLTLLTNKNVIRSEKIKTDGKGRPYKVYKKN